MASSFHNDAHPAFTGPAAASSSTSAAPIQRRDRAPSFSDFARSPSASSTTSNSHHYKSASAFGRSLPATPGRNLDHLAGLGLVAGAAAGTGSGRSTSGDFGVQRSREGSESFTADAGDIREGTAQLGDLSLIRQNLANLSSSVSVSTPISSTSGGFDQQTSSFDGRYSIDDLGRDQTSSNASSTPVITSAHTKPHSSLSPRSKPAELSGVSLAFADKRSRLPSKSPERPPPLTRQGASATAQDVIPEVSSPDERDDTPEGGILPSVRTPAEGHDLESAKLGASDGEDEESEAEGERRPLIISRRSSRVSRSSIKGSAKYGSLDSNSVAEIDHPSNGAVLPDVGRPKRRRVAKFGSSIAAHAQAAKARLGRVTKEDVKEAAKEPFIRLPAVILGVLMNILDGVSYGLITFPTNMAIFADFGGPGVSMFFVSCIVSQLVYSTMSVFKGGNGSMMIEVVPFFNSIVNIIITSIGEDKPDRIIATVIFSFAFSSLLVGLVFFLLGWFKLGRLIAFFPRHILVGCIGGVGGFLFLTGLEVTARLDGESFEWDFATLRHFMEMDVLPLWTTPLALGILIRAVSHRFSNPLIFPSCFLLIPVVFYIIVAAAKLDLDELRQLGWIFDLKDVDTPWWKYLTYFNFANTDMSAVIATIPTQLALAFFALLHVPINLPALALSTGEDNLETNKELRAHGISNALSGLVGSVPNYLCYVNSVLFYRVGGDSRVAGFLLAAADAAVLFVGPGVIGYLPVMVVGALIYILAIDLIKEALWDTWGRVSTTEYMTIWIIVIVMTVYDFVVGIGVGIVLACATFVVASSRRRPIRAILDGTAAMSTVRRHPHQSAFLRDVGTQTKVIKLQGFLFFGTISDCETTIRQLLENAAWEHRPIRFLVLDFSLVGGVDFSGAEAFLRIQRLLELKGVVMVICGTSPTSEIGAALRSVDLWAGNPNIRVEVFQSLNDSLEHCENAYLRSLYSKDLSPHNTDELPQASAIGIASSQPAIFDDSSSSEYSSSPRRAHVRQAASQKLTFGPPKAHVKFAEPLPLLMQSLGPYLPELERDVEFFFKLVPYFERVSIPQGTRLWSEDDPADAFYVIETGMLRAIYRTTTIQQVVESMLPGTISGEMTFLAGLPRNTRVTAERDTVLWRMDRKAYTTLLDKEDATVGRNLGYMLMRASNDEHSVLITHLITSS